MVFSGCISCEIHWEEAVGGTVPTARPHSALFALRTRGAEFTATPGTMKSQTLLGDRAHGTWYWSEEPSAHHMLLRIPGQNILKWKVRSRRTGGHAWWHWDLRVLTGDFPGGPVVKTLPSIAGGGRSIPGQRTKNPVVPLGQKPKHKREAIW